LPARSESEPKPRSGVGEREVGAEDEEAATSRIEEGGTVAGYGGREVGAGVLEVETKRRRLVGREREKVPSSPAFVERSAREQKRQLQGESS
jgi:hypothetical protein